MGWNVLSNLRHNGIEYKVGQEVSDLSEEAAKELEALKVIAPKVEGQVKQDVQTVEHQGEQMVNDAKADGAVVEDQVEQDLAESQAQNEQLKNQPGKPVTTGSPTAEQIAADAASVE